MLKAGILGMAMAVASMGICAPALAIGPGDYHVKGNNGEPNTDYEGTLSIVQTGESTYKLTWKIGSDKYDGFAIGNNEVMAATFSSGGSTGTALIVEDDDHKGAYKSIWAFKGDKKLGVEILVPKK